MGALYVYMVNATLRDQGIIWISDKTNTSFIINIKSGFGTTDWADYSCSFVIYKP